MFKLKFLFPLIFFLLVGNMEANSRVAFSRPGKMMRIASVDNYIYKNLLTLNLSSEVLSSSQSSSAFSVNTMSTTGYQYGISFVKPENPANSVELGFHLQKNMFEYGDVHFDVGIQDVLFRQGSDSTDADGLDTKGKSPPLLFSEFRPMTPPPGSQKVISSVTSSTSCAPSPHIGK